MVHYHGKTINGVTFDSSLDRGEPLAFAPNQVEMCFVPCFIKRIHFFLKLKMYPKIGHRGMEDSPADDETRRHMGGSHTE